MYVQELKVYVSNINKSVLDYMSVLNNCTMICDSCFGWMSVQFGTPENTIENCVSVWLIWRGNFYYKSKRYQMNSRFVLPNELAISQLDISWQINSPQKVEMELIDLFLLCKLCRTLLRCTQLFYLQMYVCFFIPFFSSSLLFVLLLVLERSCTDIQINLQCPKIEIQN